MWTQLNSVSGLLITLCVFPASVSAEIATDPYSLTQTSLNSTQSSQHLLLAPDDPNHRKPLLMYQQALNYLLGRNGVTKSTEKAANLFKILAEQNWSSAQHMLGNMYYSGKGVEKNDLLAYKWLSLASKNNLQLAEAIQAKRSRLHHKLQSSLSDESLNKVETWIAGWKPADSNLLASQ